ncbi:MAG TPA: hypothetical protein VK188_03855 [Holophaga sp.]|nr:hypothetical protein [Holophaga sp.]
MTLLRPSCLALVALSLPLAAQTPLFNDGPAFGGSRVFSDGLNPLGNPARYDQAPQGWHLSWLDGDQRAQDNKKILGDTLATDPAVVDAALRKLQDAPWAQRTRAYGLVIAKEAAGLGFTREEYHTSFARVDLTNLGANLANNGSFLDGRRAIVNRIHFGGGSLAAGTAVGFGFRFERWELGGVAPMLAQGSEGGAFPFTVPADPIVMNYATTSVKGTHWALDAGFTRDLAEGLRVGFMADQLNTKRLWDVTLKPQFRAALQLDLGPASTLTLEGDLNSAARMPFPEKQKAMAASLRYRVSGAVTFTVGGERRQIGEAAVTRLGATLSLRTQAFLVSFGFQAGQDRPMKGITAMVN